MQGQYRNERQMTHQMFLNFDQSPSDTYGAESSGLSRSGATLMNEP